MGEALAVAHMKSVGFGDAQKTPSGSDKGLDVISANAAAQVKAMQTAVGRPDLQKLKGSALGYEHLLFYSLSGYTAQAIEYAEESGLALFSFDRANNVKPVNASARWIEGTESPRVEALQTGLAAIELAEVMKEFTALSSELMRWMKLSPWIYLVPKSRQEQAALSTTTLLLTIQSLSMEAVSLSTYPEKASSFLERAREEVASVLHALGQAVEMDFSDLSPGEAVEALRESTQSHTNRVIIQEMSEIMASNFEDIPSAWNFYLPILAVFVRAQKFLKAMNEEVNRFKTDNLIENIDDDPRFSEKRALLKSQVEEFSSWINKAFDEGEGSALQGERILLGIVEGYDSMAADLGTDASRTLAYSDSQPATWLDDDEDEDE